MTTRMPKAMQRAILQLASIAVATVLTAIAPTAFAVLPGGDDVAARAALVRDWAAARRAYGLTADVTIVDALAGSAQDVGSRDWGIPLTADELALLDLNGRNLFVAAAHELLIPYVQ